MSGFPEGRGRIDGYGKKQNLGESELQEGPLREADRVRDTEIKAAVQALTVFPSLLLPLPSRILTLTYGPQNLSGLLR